MEFPRLPTLIITSQYIEDGAAHTKRLETIHRQGNQVIINWFYEEDDEDMREAGEDYQAIVNLTFNMQQVELD